MLINTTLSSLSLNQTLLRHRIQYYYYKCNIFQVFYLVEGIVNTILSILHAISNLNCIQELFFACGFVDFLI